MQYKSLVSHIEAEPLQQPDALSCAWMLRRKNRVSTTIRRRQSVQQIYKAPAFRLFCYTALSSWNCARQSWTSTWTIIHMWMMSHAFLTLFGQKTRLILFLVFHQPCPQSSTCFIMHSHYALTWTLINMIVSWPIGVRTYDSLPVVEEVFTFSAAIHLVRRTSSEW